MVMLEAAAQEEDRGRDGWTMSQKTARDYVFLYPWLTVLLKTDPSGEAGFGTATLELSERADLSTSPWH